MEGDILRRIHLDEVNRTSYAGELEKFLDPAFGNWREVNDGDHKQINGLLQYAEQQADTLQLQLVHDRIEIFRGKLPFKVSLADYLSEIRTLREAFESGIRYKRFYLYPEAKAQLYLRFDDDWRKVVAGFPQAREDAKAAVDCYALGYNTASVFHAMRVVEHGLRELATSVNVSFDIHQWQTVIEQIESEIRDIGKRWPASAAKSEWLRFYSGAAKEFFYFKDGWRNYVSHGGDPYEDPQALSVMEHVKAFMGHLAPRLGVIPAT
jgi:hypothetical protein